MCYICRVRFLCRVYRLVHHCSARHPCALGPWRDVVLAPLSIILHLPEPRARCEGGGMCCSCRTSSLLPTTHSLPPPLTIVPRLNCAFKACALYIGLPSLRDLCGSSLFGRESYDFNDRRWLATNCASHGWNKVSLDPPGATQWYLGQCY